MECPKCQKTIQDEAVICRHCGAKIKDQTKTPGKIKGLAITIFVIAGLTLVGVFLQQETPFFFFGLILPSYLYIPWAILQAGVLIYCGVILMNLKSHAYLTTKYILYFYIGFAIVNGILGIIMARDILQHVINDRFGPGVSLSNFRDASTAISDVQITLAISIVISLIIYGIGLAILNKRKDFFIN